MPTTLDLSGLDRLTAKVRALGHLDATPLMLTWMRLIDDDNRRGVLAGLDKDGIPMKPVTYRPKPAAEKTTSVQRLNQKARSKKGKFAGFGSHISGLHNNLTSSEYRLLGGPALAPRDQFSRVITNLRPSYGGPPNAPLWFAAGSWDEVVSSAGVPFLHWHFDGTSKLPRRDLRGIRPDGLKKARAQARAWMLDQVRSSS